ncbi:MAG: NTP transferase domain-containing protein [Candidatus Eisenbacteria bacterium]|nr:NTP transferase domain-containing protein [Candidatus Latescibacterota bacterium]MBD3302195.1 NTP transferase domain-containing protein [Candidatus Eisenbacteria bacterium]
MPGGTAARRALRPGDRRRDPRRADPRAAPLIAGVLLCAGSGRRFGSGRNKLLADVRGLPVVVHVLHACLASRLGAVVAVVGADREVERVLRHTGEDARRLRLVRNPDPARGMMSSVKTGLAAVEAMEPPSGAAMVLLGDQPAVTPKIIDSLIETAEANPGRAVAPICEGVLRHPRVVPAALFPAYRSLADDAKAQPLLESLGGDLLRIPLGDPVDYADVDTAADLMRIRTPDRNRWEDRP